MSGTESDSDSVLISDASMSMTSMGQVGSSLHAGVPLTSIAERRSNSGEDTEDEDDAAEGGWKAADVQAKPRGSIDESVIKAGYLWKKGERRKVRKSLDSLGERSLVFLDLEETLVRFTSCPHSLLQELGRVQIITTPRTL